MTKRLVVFASDNGTKLQAILNACADGTLDAQVVALFADKKCPAIHIAEDTRIPIVFSPWGPYKVAKKLPGTYKRDLAVKAWMHEPDFIVMAGWLRELAGGFLENYPDQVINIHPALHESFTGPFALANAFDAFQRGEISETGTTVYYARTSQIDKEDVILQEKVSMVPGESFEAFETRVRAIEPQLLVRALVQVLQES